MKKQNNDLKEKIFNFISIELKELENKMNKENTLLKTKINEINIQNNDLKQQIIKNITIKAKEIEDKNYEQIISLNKTIYSISIQNNELKEQILNNISIKLKESEKKYNEENDLLKAQINEINLQNNILKDLMIDKLKEIDDKNTQEFFSLRNQINEINIQNNDLKQQISITDFKIQSGEYYKNFIDSEYDYMYNSRDWRTFSYHINFEKEYERPPKVLVFLNNLYSDSNKNLRVSIFSSNIDTSGFDLNIQTWEDSSIYGFRIIWFSFLN